MTNAVKHFKWTPRGEHRMHKSLGQWDIDACEYWLEQELRSRGARVIVALGATALKAMLSNSHARLQDSRSMNKEYELVPKASSSTPLGIFERVVISLYDGGVLSPAVLERVIGAFAQASVDWHGTPAGRSVDGRSLHEIVVQTMLPGDDLESPSTSFITVVEHIAGAAHSSRAASKSAKEAEPRRGRSRKKADAEEDEDAGADELLAQLSGSTQPDRRRRSNKADTPASPGSFNPFLNAALPRTKKS